MVLHTTFVLRVQYSCGTVLGFLALGGNSFWRYVHTQCTIQLCGCVSVFVVVGNSSQNENTFVQKNGLLHYDLIANVCIYDLTLFYSVSFFFLFLLYHADLQVEVQIRILLKFKYRKSCQKYEHWQSHFDFLKNAYSVSLF